MSKLLSYPNMYPEILEAIHFMYKNCPDIEVDCYLCLSGLDSDAELAKRVSIGAQLALKKMGRCEFCGEELQTYHYKEPHPELEGCPMEEMTEVYCPNCDMPGQIKMEGWR